VDVAGAGGVEPGEQAEERGFAAAGGSHDGDELAARNGEVDATEDVDGAGAVADGFAEVFYDDDVVSGSGQRCGLHVRWREYGEGLLLFDTLRRWAKFNVGP
jgi:hypothetical protein